MEAYEYDAVRQVQIASGERYLQFLNAGSMSLGLYALPAGGEDLQTPHLEDEIYYIVSGRGAIVVAGDRREVVPGSIVFVGKEVEHRFTDITQNLDILVFFAPHHTP
jgi:mannose-6-phosphate isomerase-like protein (cupin superfamily)